MLKKISVVLLAFVAVFVVCWCFVFDIVATATDVQVPVSMTYNANIGNMTNISYDSTALSDYGDWYSPMISAWGDPVGYLNFDTSSEAAFKWSFYYQATDFSYIIFPSYVVHYGTGNTNSTVTYRFNSGSLDGYTLLDSRTLENITGKGGITIDYSWELYSRRFNEGDLASPFVFVCSGSGLSTSAITTWSFPIFPPKAYFSDGSGGESSESSSASSGGGGTGESSSGGGGGGDCEQWNELNQRLDNIEDYLNGINWDLNELKDKLFDDTYKAWEVSTAESKYAEASKGTQSIIDGMSIPALDYHPSAPDIPGSSSIGTVMDFVGGLWWFSVPLITACGCWVASLILYGKHDVK